MSSSEKKDRKALRVQYVSTAYPPSIGGAQTLVHQLAKRMATQGIEASALTLWDQTRRDWLLGATVRAGSAREYSWEGVQVRRIGFPLSTRMRMVPWVAAYYPLMGESVRRVSALMVGSFELHEPSPDLVHVTRIGREFLARAAFTFARERRLPVVLTPVHHPRWNGWLYREWDSLYRQADAVFALTEHEKSALVEEKGVPANRIHVTGAGPVLAEVCNPEGFRRRFGLEGRFVLFLGAQCQYKGVSALLEAARAVWAAHPDVSFVFAGPPTAYSARLFGGVDDRRVRNIGAVDLESKTSAIAASEFLCVPSTQESFGIVFVEAWALQKAVIGGRIGPVEEVIADGVDGRLTSQDPEELAQVICELLEDPDACRRMGEAGSRKQRGRYTWSVIAERTADVYRALLR